MGTLAWGGTKVWKAPLPLGCRQLGKLGQGRVGWDGEELESRSLGGRESAAAQVEPGAVAVSLVG